VFDNRAELRQAFYQLVNTTSDDDALVEQGEAVDEIANRALQYGVWNAQTYLISIGAGNRWRTTSSALTWSGSDSTGGKYTALPADCLRIAGDERNSALRSADGVQWGMLVDERDRFRVRGNYYYLLDHDGESRLWLARGANPPSGTVLDYFYRHPTWTDDTGTADNAVDFPEMDRAMIPAEAAYYAMTQSWVPRGLELATRIQQARNNARSEARLRVNMTRQPRRTRNVRGIGTHWFA